MIHLNANNILIENQHGFRPGRSCATQLIKLTEDTLEIGQILAFCLSDGNMPIERDLVKMTFSTHEISSAQCFNMSEGTPSGPLALLVSRSDNNFIIPFSEKLISGILGIVSSCRSGRVS